MPDRRTRQCHDRVAIDELKECLHSAGRDASVATERFDSSKIQPHAVLWASIQPVNRATKRSSMLPSGTSLRDASVLSLLNAVFCLDCEVISSSQGEQCPVCKGRSLVNLARMLGGSLPAHRAQQAQEHEGESFDTRITVDLEQMSARDLTTMLERISSVIAPKLARDRAAFHINVRPATDRGNKQRSLSFPELEAA